MGKNVHAVELGRMGGKAGKGVPKPKSAENGKKGGRPRKSSLKLALTGECNRGIIPVIRPKGKDSKQRKPRRRKGK